MATESFAAPLPDPRYSYEGLSVFFKNYDGKTSWFAVAVSEEAAYVIASRLNNFDLNLRERNFYQSLYLTSRDEEPED